MIITKLVSFKVKEFLKTTERKMLYAVAESRRNTKLEGYM